MDEPLSNLDAKLRSETRAELVALHRRLSSTFIYVTHDQVEAMTMGTHVAVMNRGHIEQVGTPTEVYARPASVFVAQFIGTPPMNIMPAGLVEPGDRLVGVRPEHVQIVAARRAGCGGTRMVVELVELLGHETLVHGRVGEVKVVVRLDGDDVAPSIDDEVEVRLPVEHRHRFDAATGRRLDEGVAVTTTLARDRTGGAAAGAVAGGARRCSCSTRSAASVWLGHQRCDATGGNCRSNGWDQYVDVFRSHEFQQAFGVRSASRS